MPHYDLYLPDKLNDRLAGIANHEQVNKEEVINMALALFDLIYGEKQQAGDITINIMNAQNQMVKRITDL